MRPNRASVILTVLIIFFSFSVLSWSQEGRGEGRLNGTVKDKEGKALENVKLTLEYLEYNRTLEAISNKKGSWAFLGIGPGVVKVTAELEGFVPSVIQMSVSGVNRNPVQSIVLERVSEVDPNSEQRGEAVDNFKKALALFKESKFEAALALFLDFREKQPDMFRIGINIGSCYLELKEFEKAIQEFQLVADKIKEENPEVNGNKELARLFASIGDTYMRQNNLKQAEAFFKKSIEIDPADHALAYNVAEILFAAGKTEDAIKYYKMAIEIKPDWGKSYMQLGYAYLNKGDTKSAIESLKKFLELEPDAPEAAGIEEVIKSLQ